MSNWLGNVPDPRIKFTKSLPRSEHEKLESLLDFIAKDQPGATMDYLVEEVLETFFRKRNTTFPVSEEQVSLKVTLPRSLGERVDEHVAKAATSNPRASHEDLIEHAVHSYFARNSDLLRAWRADQKAEESSNENSREDSSNSSNGSSNEGSSNRVSVDTGGNEDVSGDATESVVDRIRRERLSSEQTKTPTV